MDTETAADTDIHIFVEVKKDDVRRLEFDTDHVSGLQIKERAGVPADYDLARRHGQKLELVKNEEIIEIKDGEHFVVLPPGTVS